MRPRTMNTSLRPLVTRGVRTTLFRHIGPWVRKVR